MNIQISPIHLLPLTILGVEEPDFNDFMQEELCIDPETLPIDSSMYEQGNQALVLAQAGYRGYQ